MPEHFATLRERIQKKTCRVGILGLGYVGLPLAHAFGRGGFAVLGFDVDAAIICVPTPLTENREPDLTFVLTPARAIAARLRPGQLVVLESTTYPGTTTDVLRPILEETGLRSGVDFFIAFSPE